jgi:enoyl-CoA hydratase/carnithine racemase
VSSQCWRVLPRYGKIREFPRIDAMTDTILYAEEGSVGRLTLNNPERHNSLGEEQLRALQARLAAIHAGPGPRVLVISGAGDKTFCAGASLRELDSGQISGELFQETTDMVAALPIPTIAALNGNIFGGGVELALSCDYRVGIAGTRMRVPAAAIGLCYPVSGIERFVHRLGVSAAKRLLMAAEEFDSRQMVDIGFVDRLVERGEFATTVAAWAENLASLAPLAVRSMKEIIEQAARAGLNLDHARALSRQCQESADLQEGLSAQREKRAPRFRGG